MQPIDQSLITAAATFRSREITQEKWAHPTTIPNLRSIYDYTEYADESTHLVETLPKTAGGPNALFWNRMDWLNLPLRYPGSVALDYMRTPRCVAVLGFQTFPSRQWVTDPLYQRTIAAFNWLSYAAGDVFHVTAIAKYPDSRYAPVWLVKPLNGTWRGAGWVWEKYCALVDE